MSGSNLMYELTEGNPGAVSVVGRLDFAALAQLKQTDLRGSMIWIGYKDICGEDIELFKDKIFDHSIEGLVHETPDYKYWQSQQASLHIPKGMKF